MHPKIHHLLHPGTKDPPLRLLDCYRKKIVFEIHLSLQSEIKQFLLDYSKDVLDTPWRQKILDNQHVAYFKMQNAYWHEPQPGVNTLYNSQISHLGKVSHFLDIRESFTIHKSSHYCVTNH